jgi:hypothetical protein
MGVPVEENGSDPDIELTVVFAPEDPEPMVSVKKSGWDTERESLSELSEVWEKRESSSSEEEEWIEFNDWMDVMKSEAEGSNSRTEGILSQEWLIQQ